MKVLVCDDRETECDFAATKITNLDLDRVDVSTLHSDKLTEELRAFFRQISKDQPQGQVSSAFDEYDIIFLDNNLSALAFEGARLTAESIAGYLRAYSTSSYIISLNKNPEIDFDLRYLVGDYSTVSDLALNTPHLGNKALWTGEPSDACNGFKPWYWPTLLREPMRRRKQVESVFTAIDMNILGELGISSEVVRHSSRRAFGTLSPDAKYDLSPEMVTKEGKEIEDITFRDFFLARNRSVTDSEDRERLSNQSNDDKFIKEVVSRAIAADIDLWIRRDLVAPQDALVDIPHLIARMPFLLGSSASSIIRGWNSAIISESSPFGLDNALFTAHVRERQVLNTHWIKSPTFYWPLLKKMNYWKNSFFHLRYG